MKIKKLYLRNFRNHESLLINFDDKITFIHGDNGLGKTNILEAIYFLSTTKSLKAEVDKELISHNSNFLINQAVVSIDEEDVNLEISLDCIHSHNNRSIKKVKINQVPKSITSFAGQLKAVLFTPADLDILFSSSSMRRRYLDTIFYQVSEEYKKAVIDYTKALKHRNKILDLYKETGRGLEQLEIWTEILIREGKIIQTYRDKFFHFFENNIQNLLEKLNIQNLELKILYKKNEASNENYNNYKNKELYTGLTAFGPHKDDFEILYNYQNVANFGSRGQQRIAISILKFMELDFIYFETNQKPILLLDDIFSELDDKNKRAILNIIYNQQTVITSVYKIPEIDEFESKTLDIKELINQQKKI
jgi:DNA replication and repair protein RecF